jgi:pimeloyl-ACP methyl ester carboxylesterase
MDDDIPAARETATVHMSDGAPILLRRHGMGRGPCVAFSHGNGLAIDAYAQFWRLFCDRYDVVVFDMRNHGRNPQHGPEGHTWDRMTLDLHELPAAIAGAFGVEPIAGVFHSLSSISAMRAAVHHAISWPRLFLIDPPIYPRPDRADLVAIQEAELADLTRRAARRPDAYADWRDFAAQLKAHRKFARWRPGAHERFARATLREDDATGAWVLACPRELEAFIFETNRDATLWASVVDGLPVPVTIIGADPDVEEADAPAVMSRELVREAGLDYVCIPGTTHMLQLEEPEACAAEIMRRLEAKGAP